VAGELTGTARMRGSRSHLISAVELGCSDAICEVRLVFTGDSAEVQPTIVVGLRKQSKSRCFTVEKISEPFGSKPQTPRLFCRRDFDSWRRFPKRPPFRA